MTNSICVLPHRGRLRGHRGNGVGRPPTYDRSWDLPRLLAMWPSEIDDTTLESRRRIIARLRQALRAERQRGISGNWIYDVARHAQLLDAYRCERAADAELRSRAHLQACARRVGTE